jgi:hypothetical protein
LTAYTVLATLVSLKLIKSYYVGFELFAFITALVCVLRKERLSKEKPLPGWLIAVGIALIILTRLIPYWMNDVPLGYDAGFYMPAIDQYSEQRVETWFAEWSPPGMFALTNVMKGFGINTHTIVVYFYILLEIALGIGIYSFTKTFFSKNAAIIALFIYALSAAQYIVFQALFFKNVLALILMLVALMLIKQKRYLVGSITAICVFAVHQPTFLVFGLAYLLYTIFLFKKPKVFLKYALIGAAILATGSLFYINEFYSLIISRFDAFSPQAGPGSFITFVKYEYASLAYMAAALIGWLYTIKRKQFEFPFYMFLFSGTIVYFKLFFYHRFIIYLDVIAIVMAGYGISILMNEHRKTMLALTGLMFIAMTGALAPLMLTDRHHISVDERKFIKSLPEITEENSSILSNMVEDAPFLETYSNRTVVAPGLFGNGKFTHTEWRRYWSAESFAQIKDLMDRYDKPLYIYLGEKTMRGNAQKFNDSCIISIQKQEPMELLRYDC